MDLNRAARGLFPINVNAILGSSLSVLFPSLDQDLPGLEDLQEGVPVQWEGHDQVWHGLLRARKLTRSPSEKLLGYSVVVQKTTSAVAPTMVQTGPGTVKLTRRERQVLGLIVRDLSNKEIAENLNVTESTIKSHVHSLLKKAGVGQRDDLARVLFERN